MTSALILDGKTISEKTIQALKEKVAALKVAPKLSVILVGIDPASATYVGRKEKACHDSGILSEVIKLPSSTTQEALLNEISRLNNDRSVSGILCQVPLPKHIEEKVILEAISPEKDVDCFHPLNVGYLFEGHAKVLPCTPGGIMTLLKAYQLEVEGKHVVILGRSNIVGKPMAHLLLQANATVTICHSRTKDLPSFLKQADIVVAAIGKPEFVKGEWLKAGAIVIDVGINRVEDKSKASGFKLVGDVHYESCFKVASAITPVPGGVGPMTIATLMENVISLAALKK